MSTGTKASAGWLGASALATIGAALAMTLAPTAASAQERGQGRWGGDNAQGENRTGRGNWQARQQAQGEGQRSEGGGGWRARQAQQQATTSPAAPQVQQDPRQWRGGGSGRWQQQGQAQSGQWQGQPGQWQGRRQRQAEQAQQQVPATQGQTWQGRRGYRGDVQAGQVTGADQNWSRRNRTYSDPTRSQTYRQTYRDGYRDGNRADTWRDRRDENQAYRQGWRDNNRADRYRDGHDGRYRDGRNGYGQSHRNWNRGWRNDNRYNWYSYRNHNRNHYRLGRYHSPYNNWSYRRLSVGFFLDDLFYSNRYWIDDPYSYRLPDAYGPYRWVRYYDDALLVNIYTGEVVDVINGLFW